jgi:hypothetical protein
LLFHNDLSRITKSKYKSQNGFDILAISGIDIDTAYLYKLQNKICIRDPAAWWSLTTQHPFPVIQCFGLVFGYCAFACGWVINGLLYRV